VRIKISAESFGEGGELITALEASAANQPRETYFPLFVTCTVRCPPFR
jgi:hypothetical protein